MILKYLSLGVTTSFVKMLSSLWLFSIISSYLSPAEFAPYAAITIVIGLFTTVGGIGIAPAIIRMEYLYQGKISAYMLLSIIIGFLISLFTFGYSENFSNIFGLSNGEKYFILASPIILIKITSSFFEAILQREMKLKLLLSSDFLSYTIFHVFFQWYFLTKGMTVEYLIISLILEELSKLLLYCFILKGRLLHKPDFSMIKNDMMFSSSVTLNRALNYIGSQCDKFFVANNISAVDFSGYSRVFQFTAYPINIVGQVFDKILYPYICKMKRDGTGFPHIIVISILVLVGSCLAAFCYYMDWFVVKFFLKNEWSDYIGVYYILLALLPIRLVDRYCSIALNAENKPHYRTASQLLFLSTLSLSLYLVPMNLNIIALIYVLSYSLSAISSVFFLKIKVINETS